MCADNSQQGVRGPLCVLSASDKAEFDWKRRLETRVRARIGEQTNEAQHIHPPPPPPRPTSTAPWWAVGAHYIISVTVWGGESIAALNIKRGQLYWGLRD